jgi:4-alpha-glucanotransferase
MLRIDHVMGLHRFFWIPEGMGPAEGTYVDYPWEDLYAILCIESQRARALLLGEDLGTVPPEVPAAMERFGVLRTHVLQFGFGPEAEAPIRPVPERAVSQLNTHDMFPFAAFWAGEDLDWRLEAGILKEKRALELRRERETLKGCLVRYLEGEGLLAEGNTAVEEVACACLAWLGAGPAEAILVNLEDLWAERRPQNIPGTGPERANWMGKSVYPIEEMRDNPAIADPLRRLDRLRRKEGGGP